MWNHRVVRTVEDGEEHLEVCEVFYGSLEDEDDDDDDETSIMGWTASNVFGETMEELRQSMEWHAKALELPVIDGQAILEQKGLATS